MSELSELLSLQRESAAMVVAVQQRVVCAAVRFADGVVVLGIRHFSPDMRVAIHRMGLDPVQAREEGFVDQWGNFLNRQEAYQIAVRQGQYRPYDPACPGTLYSEDLY